MTLSRLAKNRDKQSNFQSIHAPLSYLSLSYSYSNSDMLSVSLHYIPYPSLSVSTSTFICSLCPISYCLFHTFLPLSSILKHFSILQLSHSLSFSCFYHQHLSIIFPFIVYLLHSVLVHFCSMSIHHILLLSLSRTFISIRPLFFLFLDFF